MSSSGVVAIVPPNRSLVLSSCVAAMFMGAIEGTIVATAMPTIVAELGGFTLFGWVFAAYLLPQAVTVPIYGRMADLYGRKPVFFFGATVFLIGSILCGFASSMLSLVLFRAFQGLGAGAIVPMAQTIVADLYPVRERGRIQAYLSGVWGVSAIAGPVLGALMVQHLHWSLVFWINIPIGLVAMGALGLFFKEQRHAVRHVIDIKGALLMALASGSLMLALLQAQALGWWMMALLALSIVAGIALIRQERIAPEPMLPLDLWHDRTIMVGTIGSLLIGALMMGVTAFMPTYIQGVMGLDAAASGGALALMSLCWPLGASVAARLMHQTSRRAIASTGGAGAVIGTGILLMVRPDQGLIFVYVGSAVSGLGMGLTSVTLLLSIQAAASANMRGLATSTVVFMRTVGQSLGTAVMGAVLNLGLVRRIPDAGDPVQALMDPVRRAGFTAPELATLTTAVSASLHEVYLVAALLAWAVLATTRFVPTHGLDHAAEWKTADP